MRFTPLLRRALDAVVGSGARAAAGRVLAVALIALLCMDAVQRMEPRSGAPGSGLTSRPGDRAASGARCAAGGSSCASREDRLLPDNREIAVTIALDKPSPRAGETIMISVVAWDPDDEWCCIVDISVGRSVRKERSSCLRGSGDGLGRRGSTTKQTAFEVPSEGRFVVNVRAHSRRCGSTYASERTAWVAFTATDR